ncbi:Tex family protein [Zeimonas arvi]|uniref:RNA-binding transcriptional accessory protein n=1 Tax=Zeimonas arvi TaxID=2498847 RepID=A0A5C8NY60_9BURK|nr:Tex family protein [Zeimonas arvi]TXL66051.1 RNA-binding transcriptional accessory protein [Zeimonas arvi]
MDARKLDPATAARIVARIAEELSIRPQQVTATVELIDGGATVPFIARYRKEVTGGLDDTQLRTLDERLVYLRELEERRAAIVESIAGQGKLTDALAAQIAAAGTKQRLEDLYLPYKPRRRTKGQIAKEAGLEPLADALVADPTLDPQAEAQKYLRAPDENGEHGVADPKAALDGARDILAERFAERADVLDALRERMWTEGWIAAKVYEGKEAEGEKFRDYFDHAEPIAQVPSHRALALFRGRQQGVLSLKLQLEASLEAQLPHPNVVKLAGIVRLAESVRNAARAAAAAKAGGADAASAVARPADAWLAEACRWCWRVKLLPHLETELFGRLREAAEAEAIKVFGANLKDLLLAAPAGPRAVIGLDPGIRTGVKVAVVDATGKLVDAATIYPHEPRRDWDGSIAALANLAQRHKVELVAIGNGTASRETDKLAADLIKRHPELRLRKLVVSEAGASVYSASELAAKEFPDLDVSLRGAVSIARRLQDPLAELVKIDPKSIGVGQYQHDVNQRALARQLDAAVEDCVNAVGVDVNTASAPLLARVSGLTGTVAQRVVDFRDANGAFASRESLKQVPYFGDKAFEQAAGFLRIRDGENPLDASAVHPEAYPVVQRILEKVARSAKELIGNREVLRKLEPKAFTDDRFGEPTVRDILTELEKPGRDPRGEFVTASFQDGVEDLRDLREGMKLQGVVTNVANFGAFVDIGVHQDGLVHISELADRFVKDPREVVKAGQVVSVTVLEVDVTRKRIALSMKTGAGAGRGARGAEQGARGESRGKASGPRSGDSGRRSGGGGQSGNAGGTLLGDALARALKR